MKLPMRWSRLRCITAVAGEMEVIKALSIWTRQRIWLQLSAVLIGKGASNVARAEDEKLMSDRMAVVSEVVGAAGMADITQGVEMLAAF